MAGSARPHCVGIKMGKECWLGQSCWKYVFVSRLIGCRPLRVGRRLYTPKEETFGIRGWRSRVLEGELNHWCGKGLSTQGSFLLSFLALIKSRGGLGLWLMRLLCLLSWPISIGISCLIVKEVCV